MRKHVRRTLAASAIVAATLFATNPPARAQQQQPEQQGIERHETPEQRDARMQWWRQARFGMFIHWGIYSVPAGVYKGRQINHIGEWIMNDAKIPVAEYADYAKQFNPVKFDADQWVKLAKDAGMKYIVITSKHHDGFAMFHSKVSKYNIYDATPFKRDPLAELAEACRKNDIKLGFYYSQAQDWHSPGGAASKGHPDAAGIKDFKPVDNRNHWDTAQEGDFAAYLKRKAMPQVRELLSNYGPVAVLWFDTPIDMTHDLAEPFIPLVTQLQPQIIINNRLIHNDPEIQGDTETPEQFVPTTGYPGRDWETCMTMNHTWGYKSWDHDWKSTDVLLHNLIDIASKGGNYLLNVGPTSEGVIPEPSVERLKQIGQWMHTNGDAIYATHASPFKKYAFDGRVTTKDDTLFVHVFSWPQDGGGVKLVGLRTKATGATALDGGESVTLTPSHDDHGRDVLTIAKPTKTDPIATVIAIKLAGPVDVDPAAVAVMPDQTGQLDLTAADALLNARRAKLQGAGPDAVIDDWTDKHDLVTWDVAPAQAGPYTVELTYASPADQAGSTFSVTTGDAAVQGKVADTGAADQFKTEKLGTLNLKQGVQTLSIKVDDLAKKSAMTLKQVRLIPADQGK